MGLPATAWAQAGDPALQAEFEALRAQYQALGRKLADLEARMAQLGRPVEPDRPAAAAVTSPAPAPQPVATAVVAAPAPAVGRRIALGGDVRIRQELNFGDGPSRERTVVRGRFRALAQVTSAVTAGAQLVSGDADNPRTSDETLTGFDQDVRIALDQLWVSVGSQHARLWLGKYPNPMLSSEMVFDRDVSLQGAALEVRSGNGPTSLIGRAVVMPINETPVGDDSWLLGGQVAAHMTPAHSTGLDMSVGYYTYSLDETAGVASNTLRGNLRAADGGYLSDFRLLDLNARLVFGAGGAWPVQLIGNHVRNLGAAVSGDSGTLIEMTVGTLARPGRWRFTGGYAQAGVDAVFGLFSQDNLVLATNYRQWMVGADRGLAPHLFLGSTFSRARVLDEAHAAGQALGWQNRFRLNLWAEF